MRRILSNLSPASFIFILAIAILLFGFQNCAPMGAGGPQVIATDLTNVPDVAGKTFSAQEEVFNCTSTADTVCAALYSRLLESPIELKFNEDFTRFTASNACHRVEGTILMEDSKITFLREGITDLNCGMSSSDSLLEDLDKLVIVDSIRKTGVGIVLEGATFKLPFNEM